MKSPQIHLQFSDVDGLAYAAEKGKFDGVNAAAIYVPRQIGPLIELLQLSACKRIPQPRDLLVLKDSAPLIAAIEQAKECWISPDQHRAGFIRAARSGPDSDNRLTGFLMTAKRAGRDVGGLSASVSGQLVAAMEELENNIHEHAGASETGMLAYRVERGVFEFAVADRGMGILNSLRRCSAYAALPDEGKALEVALADGASRHGPNSNHGYGFRPIFTGLVNLHGELRFRSGDHALTMDGTSPNLATARITQKAPIDGFLASVRCCSGGR